MAVLCGALAGHRPKLDISLLSWPQRALGHPSLQGTSQGAKASAGRNRDSDPQKGQQAEPGTLKTAQPDTTQNFPSIRRQSSSLAITLPKLSAAWLTISTGAGQQWKSQ